MCAWFPESSSIETNWGSTGTNWGYMPTPDPMVKIESTAQAGARPKSYLLRCWAGKNTSSIRSQEKGATTSFSGLWAEASGSSCSYLSLYDVGVIPNLVMNIIL